MSMPDKKGHFGIYGGTFAPETLMPALAELETAYLAAKKDKESLKHMSHYRVSAYLLDSYREGMRGGTGETFDWHLAVVAKTFGRIILAGGLNPDNVAEAVKLVQPYGVDVTGGVEREKGIKDHAKIKKFITEVRRASRP